MTDASQQLLAQIERMPKHAWVSRKTWARLLADNKPKFQQNNKLVTRIGNTWQFVPTAERRFPTIPREGRIDAGGQRFYLIPATVLRDADGNERIAFYEGVPVFFETTAVVATNEVLSLVGPADFSDPEPLRWEVDDQATNVNAKYSPLVVFRQLTQATPAPPPDTLPLHFA